MNNLDPLNASSTELADVLGMTRQRVSQLRSAGVIANNGKRGRYDLSRAVPAYLQYLRDNARGDADIRLKTQQERKLRLQNDKIEAGLVPIGEAAQALASYATQYRSYVTGQLEDMAAMLSTTDSPREVAKIMQADLQGICKTFDDGVLEAIENER